MADAAFGELLDASFRVLKKNLLEAGVKEATAASRAKPWGQVVPPSNVGFWWFWPTSLVDTFGLKGPYWASTMIGFEREYLYFSGKSEETSRTKMDKRRSKQFLSAWLDPATFCLFLMISDPDPPKSRNYFFPGLLRCS